MMVSSQDLETFNFIPALAASMNEEGMQNDVV